MATEPTYIIFILPAAGVDHDNECYFAKVFPVQFQVSWYDSLSGVFFFLHFLRLVYLRLNENFPFPFRWQRSEGNFMTFFGDIKNYHWEVLNLLIIILFDFFPVWLKNNTVNYLSKKVLSEFFKLITLPSSITLKHALECCWKPPVSFYCSSFVFIFSGYGDDGPYLGKLFQRRGMRKVKTFLFFSMQKSHLQVVPGVCE